MNDDKIISDQNQTPEVQGPIFETVQVENQQTDKTDNLKPEEVAPDIASPDDMSSSSTPPEVPSYEEPVIYEESKSKYFIIAGVVIICFIFLFFIIKLIGGMTAKKSSNKPVKLIYWGLWEEKEVFESVISQYQAKNKNITIEYQKMAPFEYREKLIARSKNGQGPDIFRFHNTWLPEIKDVVSPLPSSVMSKADFEKTFYPIHQKDLKIGSYYYGIPLTIDGLVLLCNEDLFKKSGIKTMPTNWDEVINDVAKLSVKDTSGNLVTAGIALGTASNIEHFSDIFGLILIQNGGDLLKLDQETAAGALESYRKFSEDPNNSFWDETMPNSITAFTQEKVAMIIVPSWEILVIKASNADIKMKSVPIPVVPGGKQVSLASYWVEGVSKYSKNQLEAWKFLEYLSQKETMTKLFENESKIRLFGEPYSRVDLASSLAQHEYLGSVIQQANYFISLPLVSRTFDNGLNDGIIKYIENAINATAQGTNYQDALKTAKQGIDQILSRYKLE